MKTALVTGANRGIGLAVAQALAKEGLRVFLGCRTVKDGQAEAALLTHGGAQARAVAMDVASPASIEAAMAEFSRERIEVDILVNNAGVYLQGDCMSMPMEAMRESLEVHVLGPLALARALMPGMARRGYGRVVNVSSGYGSFAEGLMGDPAYSVSKAALNALTVKLAREASPGVKVNAVCPGWVRTRMGGAGAERSVEQGAETIVWLATLPPSGPHGGFFRDRAAIAW